MLGTPSWINAIIVTYKMDKVRIVTVGIMLEGDDQSIQFALLNAFNRTHKLQ